MGLNVLSFTALNPSRRFPQAEAQILQMENVARFVFDFAEDARGAWYDNVLRKYQRARRMTLDGGYTHLLTAESDMLLPRDAVTRLAALDAPVAYGVYCLRHGAPVWNVTVAQNEEAGFFLTDPIVRANAANEWRAANALVPFQCYGTGFGITLIARSVLEEIEFRNFGDAESFYVDWLFSADCNARGIRQMCEPRVQGGHITETRLVLYPDLAQANLCRTEQLRD